MIIQFALIAALLAMGMYSLSQRKRSPSVSLGMGAISLLGVVVVVAPDLATRIAHFFGVGRGADLIFYCFIVFTLLAIFNIHLRLRAEKEQLTELARAIALITAKRPENIQ